MNKIHSMFPKKMILNNALSFILIIVVSFLIIIITGIIVNKIIKKESGKK